MAVNHHAGAEYHTPVHFKNNMCSLQLTQFSSPIQGFEILLSLLKLSPTNVTWILLENKRLGAKVSFSNRAIVIVSDPSQLSLIADVWTSIAWQNVSQHCLVELRQPRVRELISSSADYRTITRFKSLNLGYFVTQKLILYEWCLLQKRQRLIPTFIQYLLSLLICLTTSFSFPSSQF